MEDENFEDPSSPTSPKESISPEVLRHNLKNAVKRNEKLKQRCDALSHNFSVLEEDYNKKKEIISQLLKEKEALTEKNSELVGRIENKDLQIEQLTNLFNEKDEECKKLNDLNDELVSTFNQERMNFNKEIEILKKNNTSIKSDENSQDLLLAIQIGRAHV